MGSFFSGVEGGSIRLGQLPAAEGGGANVRHCSSARLQQVGSYLIGGITTTETEFVVVDVCRCTRLAGRRQCFQKLL